MKNETKHSQLKAALFLDGIGLVEWAENLQRPDGETGVSHTAVIRVSQGHVQIAWIEDAIDRAITESKKKYPEFWEKRTATTT